VLWVCRQILPHHGIDRAREGQQHVIIQSQHLRQLAEDMRRWDALVELDVKQILGAERRGVFLQDLVGETAQRQPPHLAGLFDDLSEPRAHAHDLLNSFVCIALQTL